MDFAIELYLPSGAKVNFTDTMPQGNKFEVINTLVSELLNEGFLTHAPGLGQGEHKEQIGYVSRRKKLNDDNTITPVIDLFVNNERMQYRFIAVDPVTNDH